MKGLLAAMILVACASTPGFWRWAWSRNAEANVAYYRIETHYAEALHFPCQACCDDVMPCTAFCDSTCISYAWTAPFLAAMDPQPVSGADVCTEWDSGGQAGTIIPSLDSILFVNVRAVDSAGNVGN